MALQTALAQTPMLRGLTYPALRRIAHQGRLLQVKESLLVIGPNLGSTGVYVVLEGSISVVVPWGPTVATLGTGGIFGEMALLFGCERTAFCKAAADSLLFEIALPVFHAEVLTQPITRAALQELGLRRRQGLKTVADQGNVLSWR